MEELLQYHSRELKMFDVTCMEKAFWFLWTSCWGQFYPQNMYNLQNVLLTDDVFRNITIWIWLCLIFQSSSWAQCLSLSNIWGWVCPGTFTRGKYLSEILFLMSCMWCNVELRTIDSDVGFQTVSWVFFSVPVSWAYEYFSCTRGLGAQ